MQYNSLKYWQGRSNPNDNHGITKSEAQSIREFVKGGISLLDFGCGTGRTFHLYRADHERKVVGIDFVTNYQAEALKMATDVGLDFTHVPWNVHRADLPFFEEAFDKGLLIKVLLHANDKEARRIIEEMARACQQTLLIAYNKPGKTAKHCFTRAYRPLLEEMGLNVLSHKHVDNQDIIIFTS